MRTMARSHTTGISEHGGSEELIPGKTGQERSLVSSPDQPIIYSLDTNPSRKKGFCCCCCIVELITYFAT